MHFKLSERGQDYLERVKSFMREHVEPAEPAFWAEARRHDHGGDWRRWVGVLKGSPHLNGDPLALQQVTKATGHLGHSRSRPAYC